MEKGSPRILVITVPSWNDKVGANTWASILSEYPAENIASICIRDDIPNSKVCSRYFCVSENRIIKSLLRRGYKTGYEVTSELDSCQAEEDLAAQEQLYRRMKKKRRYSMLMARELIWKLGRWRTPELDEFIDSFKPDIILHSMEGYIHINRIIEYALCRTGAKALGYIYDDNFTYKQYDNIGYKIYRFFQRRSLKRLASLTDGFFAISDMTKREADAFFGIDCRILTKPLNSLPDGERREPSHPMKMLYTGNLLIGRDRTVSRVVSALNELNRDERKIELDIYTGTYLEDDIRAKIESDCCRLHAPVPQSEVLRLQKDADILLFAEDIDGKDAKAARLSFSTKITDYLSAGRCIFAVGNADTAPMRYFAEGDVALTASTDNEIAKCLVTLTDKSQIDRYAARAADCGMRNHSPDRIRTVFDTVLRDVLK